MSHRRSPSLAAVLALAAVAGCSGSIYGPGSASGGIGAGSGGSASGGNSAGVGAGGSGGSVSDAGFLPVVASSAVAKVKNLLTGLPPSDDELGQVQSNAGALRDLVAQWIATPQYQQKLLSFFGAAFQQNASAISDFLSQSDQRFFAGLLGSPSERLMLANQHELFARTALELIKEGRPFTETYTTTRFMLTPALAGYFAILDSWLVDDNGKIIDQNRRRYPNYGFKLQTSRGPRPSSEVIDPHSPNFLTLYTPSLPSQTPSQCTQDPLPYDIATVPYDGVLGFEQDFYGLFLGHPLLMSYLQGTAAVAPLPVSGAPNDGGIQCPPPDTSSLAYDDYDHWRMVQLRQPGPGEPTTPFFDYDTIRTGGQLVLDVPRVGFFTTPSFLAIWGTNSSNQFRVTMNQTMIVGTNEAFTGMDGTAPLSLAAVDQAHASDTACFACHQQLDPMRQFFRHDYSLYFHQQTLKTPENLVAPQFAWEGVAQQGSSIFDLGRLLSQQPHVAATWVQNLCQWANSAPCDEADPEFQRVASVFQRSNFNWNALMVELFSSPLISQLAPTQSAQSVGEVFGISRQAHLCALLANRLRLPDVCGLEPQTAVPYTLKPVQTIAAAYPSDAFSRGQVGPVLANDPSLFLRTGLENICVAVAQQVVDTGRNYSSGQPNAAIQDFAHNLMGLTSDRAAPMLTLLQQHYNEALQQTGIKPTDALKSTFVLACLSPYVAGLGQ